MKNTVLLMVLIGFIVSVSGCSGGEVEYSEIQQSPGIVKSANASGSVYYEVVISWKYDDIILLDHDSFMQFGGSVGKPVNVSYHDKYYVQYEGSEQVNKVFKAHEPICVTLKE